jgi:type III secretion protein U
VAKNLKNIFSVRNLTELFKSLAKITFFAGLLAFLIWAALPDLVAGAAHRLGDVLAVVGWLFKGLTVGVIVVHAAIALFDLVWQRRLHRKRLMMSKQEVIQEYKEMEGSPHIKNKRKQLRREIVDSSPAASAGRASALVVNPTHLAIAIYYEPDELPLPVVLAKGTDSVAKLMVAAARRAGVPVIRDVPLAWALMADAKVDDYIPIALIEPVAEMLRRLRNFGAAGTHSGAAARIPGPWDRHVPLWLEDRR